MQLQNLTLRCWLPVSLYSLWNQRPRMDKETWSRRGWRGCILKIVIAKGVQFSYVIIIVLFWGGKVLIQHTLSWTPTPNPHPPPFPWDVINDRSLYKKCSHAKQAVYTKSIRLWMSEENFHKGLSRITLYRLLPPQGFRLWGGTLVTRAYIKDSTYSSNIQSVY